jgi:hypothetical protein
MMSSIALMSCSVNLDRLGINANASSGSESAYTSRDSKSFIQLSDIKFHMRTHTVMPLVKHALKHSLNL